MTLKDRLTMGIVYAPDDMGTGFEDLEVDEEIPELPETPAPTYVTQDALNETMASFMEQLASRLAPPPVMPVVPVEEPEWDDEIVQKAASKAEQRAKEMFDGFVAELNARELPDLQMKVVNLVGKDLDPTVQTKIAERLKGSDANSLRQIMNHPEVLDMMAGWAQNEHNKIQRQRQGSAVTPIGGGGFTPGLANSSAALLAESLGLTGKERAEFIGKYNK